MKYSHSENRTLVELHYRLVDNEALLNYEFDELWSDREILKVGGVDVAVMGRRHLPTYLCVHGAAHAWERLCWLIDLAAALPSPTAVTEAIEFACARGIAVPMLHAILLAHRWLGLSVTESELARAKNCRKVARLEALLARSYGAKTWYRSPARGSIEGFLRYSFWLRCFAFSLTPGWQYRKKLDCTRTDCAGGLGYVSSTAGRSPGLIRCFGRSDGLCAGLEGRFSASQKS